VSKSSTPRGSFKKQQAPKDLLESSGLTESQPQLFAYLIETSLNFESQADRTGTEYFSSPGWLD
jgi:hypothetical protein